MKSHYKKNNNNNNKLEIFLECRADTFSCLRQHSVMVFSAHHLATTHRTAQPVWEPWLDVSFLFQRLNAMVFCASCLEHNHSLWFRVAFLGAFRSGKIKLGFIDIECEFSSAICYCSVGMQNELAFEAKLIVTNSSHSLRWSSIYFTKCFENCSKTNTKL